MLDRVSAGTVPPKHHVALRSDGGALRYEECLTRRGFDGPYSILYHANRPHTGRPVETPHRYEGRVPASRANKNSALRRRHFRSANAPEGNSCLEARLPLLYNDDVTLSVVRAQHADPAYFVNADGDELFFVQSGSGTLRSVFGDLEFRAGDYVCIPKGIIHRFIPVIAPAFPLELFLVECRGGVGLPQQWRNEVGQLRMDAPYCHRDFRRPTFQGLCDEGVREVIVKRHDVFHGFLYDHAPLDVVGWDGTVYPWAFPILAFQPRVSSVHLPPTWHGTFAARGALICSFVPRPLDFHPEAIPCPYPHSSVDIDEVIYYVSGAFSSRTGVAAGSVTLHPAGIPHGPHPGRYEGSLGATYTDETAVMLDCTLPLTATPLAEQVEEAGYEDSFV